MKIKELIIELQKVLKEHGNLTVVTVDFDCNNMPMYDEASKVNISRHPTTYEMVVDVEQIMKDYLIQLQQLYNCYIQDIKHVKEIMILVTAIYNKNVQRLYRTNL